MKSYTVYTCAIIVNLVLVRFRCSSVVPSRFFIDFMRIFYVLKTHKINEI